jgi:RND family efflux transporter MFP subunit
VADRDLETARNQLAAAQSQLAAARAQQAGVQKQAGKTSVRSPINGIVSERPVSAGDVVAPGGPLFTIVDPGSMRLEGNVPASELGQVRPGATVRFTVTGYPGQTFTGTVQRVNPAADPVTRMVPVYVSIPNNGGRLVAGLFAEGRVQAQARQGILVPASAVDERGVQPSVLRLRAGKVERVPVTLGARVSETDRVEITSGVQAGDTLLTGAALGTSPGTRVTVRASAAAPSAPAAR